MKYGKFNLTYKSKMPLAGKTLHGVEKKERKGELKGSSYPDFEINTRGIFFPVRI
jgi:hypothetical protein